MAQNPGQQGQIPPQHQAQQPGRQGEMTPQPQTGPRATVGTGKLQGKVALITGGDSGIGRAVAVLFAREGADIAIVYLDEHDDAQETQRLVREEGHRCLAIAGDIGDERFCERAVAQTVQELGRLDVLVNHAGEQHQDESIEGISAEQLERTFRTNVYSQFYLSKFALKHLQPGSAIVNTASVNALKGNKRLADYSASKGAIMSFTFSLAQQVVEKGIRVNAVAPGPVWTPLIPATFPAEAVEKFGKEVPMQRPGQPEEIAPSYLFLASDDASYMTGQVLHPNGGTIIGG